MLYEQLRRHNVGTFPALVEDKRDTKYVLSMFHGPPEV